MKRLLIGLLALTAASAVSAQRGVTDDEILVGGMHDLSGVFSAFSVPAVRAAQQYFDEVNAEGGVHGRRIRYIVEDHGYQVPRSMQAANKLVNRDGVFAMLMNMGTPHNLAAFRVMDRQDVPSLFPLALSRQMQEEGDFSRRFVYSSSYYHQVRAALEWMESEKGIERLCIMYIPSDFGEEVHQAGKDVAESSNMTLVAATSHRPDESDFSGTLSRLRSRDCELVVLAVAIRPIISVMATARDMGWDDVKFMVSPAGFHSAVAAAPGGVTEGLYGPAAGEDIYSRIEEPEVAEWVEAYNKAHGDKPNTGAALGRTIAEVFVRGLEAAGRDLTVDSLVAALETLDYEDPISGARVIMNADNHEAISGVYVSQVQDGVWNLVEVLEPR